MAAALCDSSACVQFPEYPKIECDYVSYLSSAKQDVSLDMQKASSYLAQEIQKAREHIKSSLDKQKNLIRALDTSRIDELEKTVNSLITRISELEVQLGKMRELDQMVLDRTAPAAKPAGDGGEEGGLFDSDDEEDPEAERIRAERLAEYEAKKATKPAVVAKSNIIFDVKPWGDDTDLVEMERLVRSIQADGLIWGSSKLVPVGYGIKKLQISCVVEDDKVGTDFLEEAMTEFEDYVQSVDVVAFNKGNSVVGDGVSSAKGPEFQDITGQTKRTTTES
ncbi:EF-1 guanine nucleotide exchange domain protein [Opisthorchis viverrini]|uniref:EF-1 guanine nucleotide exchange domain protein n=1 Tax=Opisthorchis viverrini TaxID=6198 RepID=A0A1S8WQ84_OPIVI|nr:EF-1 guanine nucleotide exchange domain protein [Opisthorchis viverrini]